MKRVLILDDDLAVLDALEETLMYGDFQVHAISSTGDIFQDIESYNPDVILLDYILKGTNGGILCQMIKKNARTSHIPIIMTSAYPKDLNDKDCNFGFDDFIAKPFDIEDLLEVVRKHADVKATVELSRPNSPSH